MATMGRRRGPRLSVEPLLNMLKAHDIDEEFIAEPLNGVLRKAKFDGFFTLNKADDIACHVLKMHPFEVWGQEYEDKVWFDMHDADDAEEMAVAA